MRFKMVAQEEAVLSLTSEGVFANGLHPSDCNKCLASQLFETISLRGGTLYNLLNQLQWNDVLRSVFVGTISYDYIVKYLSYINWGENKNLYKQKFGETPQFKSLKITPQTYFEDGIIHLDNRFNVKGVTADGDENSLFGLRLEDLLDIPLDYDGVIMLSNNESVCKPLLLGELINTLTSEVYCLTEGASDVSEHLNYLPK